MTVYGSNLQKHLGLDSDTPSRVADGREVRACKKVSFDTLTVTDVAANFLTTSDLRCCFLPFGSKVYGAEVRMSEVVTGANAADIGIVGLSGTSYDNDTDALANNVNVAAATNINFGCPNDATSGQALPYEVTDPKGAYVKITPLVNGSDNGNTVFKVAVEYAQT